MKGACDWERGSFAKIGPGSLTSPEGNRFMSSGTSDAHLTLPTPPALSFRQFKSAQPVTER